MKNFSEIIRLIAVLVTIIIINNCSFSSHDIYRPLVRDRDPDYDKQIKSLTEYCLREALQVEPETAEKRRLKSLKLVKREMSHYNIQKYDDYLIDTSIGNISLSLARCRNPFGWNTLGAYLALNHQMEAAKVVAERALIELENIKKISIDIYNNLSDIELLIYLNLAMYLESLGESEASLKSLESTKNILAENIFFRMFYYWIRIRALIGAGKLEEAENVLKKAWTLSNQKWPRYREFSMHYPQYFKTRKRRAVLFYLKSGLEIENGDIGDAEKSLKAALKEDTQLLDALYLLGEVSKMQGRYKEAIQIFKQLTYKIEVESGLIYRPEYIYFSLGNTEKVVGELNAAISSYTRAINISEKRASDFEKKVHDLLQKYRLAETIYTMRETIRIKENGKIDFEDPFDMEKFAVGPIHLISNHALKKNEARFSDAYVARGLTKLEIWNKKQSERENLLDDAMKDMKFALTNPRFTEGGKVQYYIADIYLKKGDYQRYFQELSNALILIQNNTEEINSLLELSKSKKDVISLQGFELALDIIASRNPKLWTQLKNIWSQIIEDRLEKNDNLISAKRVKGRLCILNGDLSCARKVYESAAENYEKDIWPFSGLAYVEYNTAKPNYDKIRAYLKRAEENIYSSGITNTDRHINCF
jgi:tetratricopeptide (TPR) repeat protein